MTRDSDCSRDSRRDANEGVDEQWRDVSGYEGLYAVSSLGRVRTAARPGSRGGLMAWVGDGRGYPHVKLSKNNVSARYSVHRLVCRAFHGEPLPGQEVAHRDNDRGNPRADNLRWATRGENSRDKVLHGTHQAGEQHPRAKLTEALVDEIRKSRAAGKTTVALAAEYGVGSCQISRICRNESWRTTPKRSLAGFAASIDLRGGRS